ncbi:MAG: SMC family ATPase [Actinobacteria bacterium]|nr:MAG: SMC family ATPase [Actinomycetota bacterium]
MRRSPRGRASVRPLRLEVKGFTAYRETQVLDFEDLDLFAVTGSTGSGKSSLLDAITYALYGRVPRIGNRASLLISQGQPRLAVMFDFAVDGQRYRVTRSTGQKAASATLRLERQIDGAWQSFGDGADRIRDATRLIEELIGLDYPAFTRSVLLPQGEFQEFLVGDAKERREILIELLGLELFVRMAKRAGEEAGAAHAGALHARKMLDDRYSGVDKAALRDARKAVKEAAAKSEAMGGVERSLEGLARDWQSQARRIEAVEGLAEEAEELARSAGTLADGLERLTAEVEEAERRAASREDLAKGAAVDVEESGRALAEAEERLGTGESLAALRATLEELGRVDGRIAAAQVALSEVRALSQARATALEQARRAATEAGAALERAEAAAAEAEREHERVHTADQVAALVRGKLVGDPCPVCERPLEAVPKIDARGLDEAVRMLETAHTMRKRAEAAWSRADRDLVAGERDLNAAREDLQRREADLSTCDAERDAVLVQVQAVFGGAVPDDPASEIDSRAQELRGIRERLAASQARAKEAEAEATQAREAMRSVAARTGELVGGLRGLSLGRLVERARESVPELDVRPQPAVIPSGPGAAAVAARDVGSVADGVAKGLRAAVVEARHGLQELLDRARDALPAGMPVALVTDVEELLLAVRATARELVEAATEARKDAERLAQRVTERDELEKQAKSLEKEAAIYQALAAELRADRLIDFLQGEALELLAAAGSERLLFLSQNRYRLAFEDDEFFVEDGQNGDERRPVRTLSGGETFLASLALALALSDQLQSLAVTSRARLQSLFIDEGFGALDQEVLEVASEALSQLGGQDRLVGVITHVSELAERLPVRIEVKKLPAGSRLERVS